MSVSDGHVGYCEDKTACNSSLESLDASEKQLIANLETGEIETQTLALEKIVYMYDSKQGEYSGSDKSHLIPIPSPDFVIKIQNVFHDIEERIDNRPHAFDRKLTQEMFRLYGVCMKALCSILEFLSKLKEPKILEPMMPTIRSCLEDIDISVRRSALDAISTIYKNFDFLIPDYIELITSFIDGEQEQDDCNNSSNKWEAFKILCHTNQEKALSYLSTCKDFFGFGFVRQLDIINFIHRVCHQNPSEKSRFIPCMNILLKYGPTFVRYEAAGTLVTLSDDPDDVKIAISAYIGIIFKESMFHDNFIIDVRITGMVLKRFVDMSHSPGHKKILAEQVVEILRDVFCIKDLEVKMKIISLAMEMGTSGDIKEVVLIIKEEINKINKTSTTNEGDNSQYGQFLDKTLQCAFKKQTEKIKIEMNMYKKKDEQSQIIFAEQKDKIARLDEKSLCKICLNKDVEMVFLPCGHLACKFCGHRVSDCHICRKLIQKKHKIFLS